MFLTQTLVLFALGWCLATFISVDSLTDEQVSEDCLFGGDLKCFQATKGYRFSIDSVLISHFVSVLRNDRILDLGSGCGIIMLILLYRWGKRIRDIVGIEVQHNLASLARNNLQANSFQTTGRIVEDDVRNLASLIEPESFDTIVCNPPFYGPGSGRQSFNNEARLARHQILATPDDFLFASALAVRNKGSVYFIYPAGQIATFITLLDKHRLEVKKLRFVYSYPQMKSDARLVLIECIKNGGKGVNILAPLYIYSEKNGPFTEETQAFYKKNACLSC